FAALLEADLVGLAKDVAAFLRHLAGNADGEARTGERMPPDERRRQAELAPKLADLVLEQPAKRLDQRHVHPLGQPPDVVMALDRHAWTAGEADALDHVGVERSLGEEVGAADLRRLRVEHVDEGLADELALGLRAGDSG